MSKSSLTFVVPETGSGYMRWLQCGSRKAEHNRRKRLGLTKLKPITSNQDEGAPKLPFPMLVDNKAIFSISPEYMGYANRFRRRVIVNRFGQ